MEGDAHLDVLLEQVPGWGYVVAQAPRARLYRSRLSE